MLVDDQPAAWNPDAGVIDDARARQRRQRVAGVVLTAGAAAVAFLVAFGGGSGTGQSDRLAKPGQTPAATSGLHIVNAACVWHPTLTGRPSRSLLSLLGVLRRPGQTVPASVLTRIERPAARSTGIEYHVNYVRLARSFGGTTYYVAAVHYDGCEGAIPQTGDGVLLAGLSGGAGGGFSFGGQTALESGRWVGTGGPGVPGVAYSGTVNMIVPDGVASATIHYPAGPADGFKPKVISPPVTVTGKVVGNVLLFNVPRSSGGGQIDKPTWMVWRNASGKIIRRFNRRL